MYALKHKLRVCPRFLSLKNLLPRPKRQLILKSRANAEANSFLPRKSNHLLNFHPKLFTDSSKIIGWDGKSRKNNYFELYSTMKFGRGAKQFKYFQKFEFLSAKLMNLINCRLLLALPYRGPLMGPYSEKLNPSVPDAPNWRISDFKKRLRETEPS